MAKNIEIWKDLIGFEDNYLISSYGKVQRKESIFLATNGRLRRLPERMMSGKMRNKGYSFVYLQKTGCGKKYAVHRLVAMTFIQNPKNLPQVNHKNGIRDDNRVENLEWVTNEYNSWHSREILKKDVGIKNRIPVRCVNNGKKYKSSVEAAKQLRIPKNNICNVLKGRHKTTYGYKFKYA